MVVVKYAPIAAACISLVGTGVGASVLAKRQADQPVPDVGLTPAVDGALGSPPSSFEGQALSNRAVAGFSDVPLSLNITGNAPGTTNENRAVLALTPGTTVTLNGVNLSITQLSGITDLVTVLATVLVAFAKTTTPPTPVPVPAPASGIVSGTLSGPLSQGVTTISGLLGSLTKTIPSNTTVPASVTGPLNSLTGVLGGLLPTGTTGVSPSDPVGSVGSVVATLTVLLPLLTGLVGVVSGTGL